MTKEEYARLFAETDHPVLSYLRPVRSFAETTWIDGNKKEIQMYPYDSWDHPIYGTTTITPEIAEKFVENFNNQVRGQDIHSDYEHGMDTAKGNKASGKILSVEARDNGVFGLVEFTDQAKQEIDAGEWNYWSTSHYDSWTHPHTKETHEFVIDGGGLTNKPYVKGMLPLNFSEVMIQNPELVSKPIVVVEPELDDKDKGGEEVTEAELRALLGIKDDVDPTEHITTLLKEHKEFSEELAPLRELREKHEQKKQFAEMYPTEAAKLEQLEKKDQENFAKSFSESFVSARVTRKVGTGDEAKDEATTLGLSSLVVENIKNMAKEFSEGKPKFETFKTVLDSVISNGIVDYGNKGSSAAKDDDDDPIVPDTPLAARKLFNEKITEIMVEDKIDNFDTAYGIAAQKHPELYEAYKTRKPIVTANS